VRGRFFLAGESPKATPSPPHNKPSLRQWGKLQRSNLSNDYHQQASANILSRLCHYLTQIEAQHLLIYRSSGCEVTTDALFFQPQPFTTFAPTLRHGTMEWLACSPDTDWIRGKFNILEPLSNQYWHSDLLSHTVLACPLTAFDRRGKRLGMGKGYFDRWLTRHRASLDAVVGLAFACQEASSVPTEPHDQPLQHIFTESEQIQCL